MRSCLIADDHALVRGALAAMVASRWPGATTVEATDFPGAWAVAPGHDLILSDLDMPGATPVDGIARLRAAAPDTPLVVVTGSHDDALLLDLLAAGVAGFVAKTAPPAVIGAAIDLVLAGGRYLPPRLAELVAASVRPAAGGGMTSRQVEVLRLVAGGGTNKDIARALGVAPSTVKTHVAQVLAIVGAATRTAAAAAARAQGLV